MIIVRFVLKTHLIKFSLVNNCSLQHQVSWIPPIRNIQWQTSSFHPTRIYLKLKCSLPISSRSYIWYCIADCSHAIIYVRQPLLHNQIDNVTSTPHMQKSSFHNSLLVSTKQFLKTAFLLTYISTIFLVAVCLEWGSGRLVNT